MERRPRWRGTRLLIETCRVRFSGAPPYSKLKGVLELMPRGLNRLVLVLNASYEPINTISARRAMTMITKGVALVELPSSEILHTDKINLQIPSVIRLRVYRRVPKISRLATRKGVLLRDRSMCQYCGQKLLGRQLTLDHVIPQSRGGPGTWENLVSSCFPCNNKKADRTPEEAGMQLLQKPMKLGIHAKHRLIALDQDTVDSWGKFMF